VVHTGVKSLGCENNTHQALPIQLWKRIGPSVLSAMKSGAWSPNLRAIASLLLSCFVAGASGWRGLAGSIQGQRVKAAAWSG
jgi:hypothetical protein